MPLVSPTDLCVLGSLNMDLVVRAPRLPGPGETLLGGPFQAFVGGKGNNQAVAAARLDANVTMLGAVGNDAYGGELEATLQSEGVDVSKMLATANAASGVALITVENTGENTIVVAPGANGTLTTANVERWTETIHRAKALVMQLEVPLEVVLAAAETANDAGVAVVLNAAPAQDLPRALRTLRALLELVDTLVVNEHEAKILGADAAGRNPETCVRELRSLGPRRVALTLGAAGAVLVDDHGFWRQGGFAVDCLDAVGAGDAFVGSLAVALGEGMDEAAALRFACAAGALATTRPGAQSALPHRAEVEALCSRCSRGSRGSRCSRPGP